MKNLNLELDKVLDLLKKNDLDITENVEELTSSIKQIEKQIEKDTERDHYMTAEEALKYGLIDGILDVRK